MADETIQDDHPVIPPATVPKAEREPVTIDGEVIGATPETPEDEPAHAEAPDAESAPAEAAVDVPKEASAAPAQPLPNAPPPASPSRGGSVVSAGVGALIGAAAALAVSYVYQPSAPDLQPLTNKLASLDSAISGEVAARKALESRLATLEGKPAPAAPSKDATPSKDSAALEARLKKLEGSPANADALAAAAADAKAARGDAAKALATVASMGAASGSTGVSAPNPEIAKLVGDQQSLDDRFAKLEATVGALKSAVPAGPDPELEKLAGDEKALTQRVNKLEAAFEAPKTNVRADPNVVAKGDPVAQSVAAIELERRLTAGEGYAVEWAALEKLGADSKSLAALKPYAQAGAPTLATLSAGFAKLAPDLGATAKKPDHGSYTDVLWDEVKGLVKVRPAGEIKGDDPAAVTTQISAALARGDLLAARAGFAKLPEKQRETAASWSKDLDGVVEAKAAAMSLIETSLSRLSDQKN